MKRDHVELRQIRSRSQAKESLRCLDVGARSFKGLRMCRLDGIEICAPEFAGIGSRMNAQGDTPVQFCRDTKAALEIQTLAPERHDMAHKLSDVVEVW